MITLANSLTVEKVSLTYPRSQFPSVSEISFTLAPSQILSIVGKSGSGKSSLLRAISGLERPQEGRITLGETLLSGPGKFLRPDQRKIGLVSQSGDLFPHLTIAQNVTYGLKKWRRSDKKKRCLNLLEAVGLAGLEKRYPHQLSGGEAQRVALIRALAPRPALLLMDEPFSNLDTMLREHLRRITVEVLRKEQTTVLFVTHHPYDALAVGDQVAVMHHAKIIQYASARTIWENPASAEVAALFGSINEIQNSEGESGPPDWLRSDQITLGSESPECLAKGKITAIEFLGSFQQIFVQPDDQSQEIKIKVPASQSYDLGERVGVRRNP